MKAASFCLFLVLAPCAAHADSEPRYLYTALASDSYSEIAPIKQLLDDLEGPRFDRGDLAFSHSWLELGERRGAWEVGVFARYDYFLEFNNDTAELAYADKNNIELEKNRRYQVYLQPNTLRARGVGVGYYFAPSAAFSLRLRGNYLRASQLSDGKLAGELLALEDSVEANLQLDYNYSRDALLKREEERVRGNGLSLDVDLQWQIASRWRLDFRSRDLLSAIWWRDVTYTRATAISDTISYDDDGSINARPAVSGVESYRDHRQTLPRQLSMGVHYQWREPVSASVTLQSHDKYLFPQLAVQWQAAASVWQASYDIERRALGLSLQRGNVALQLRADAVAPDKAKAFSLALNYRIPLYSSLW